MICCRNLLIYLNNELQKRLLSIFHYALKPNGVLFLGASESIGTRTDLFTAFDQKWKFFRSLGRTPDYINHLAPFHPTGIHLNDTEIMARTAQQQNTIGDLARKILYDIYTPACAVIKEDGTILYFSGRTGKFLEPAPGKANLNIYNMTRGRNEK